MAGLLFQFRGSPVLIRAILGAMLAQAACTPEWKAIDADGDGADALSDCWDNPVGPSGLSGADIYPGAADTWYDGVDADCAGNDDFDADLDGYVPVEHVDKPTLGVKLPLLPGGDCWDGPGEAPPEFVALNGYEQPGPESVNPGATDSLYDGVDQDCAQQATDCDADCQARAEFDADGDGYDSAYMTRRDGTAGDDCHDIEGDAFDNPAGIAPADAYPDANDTPYDNTDQDCAADNDWDQDQDGYPCTALPDDLGACEGDCDDTDPSRYPDFSIGETWYDGIDANCDGHSDYDQDFDDEDSLDWGGGDCNDVDGDIYSTAVEVWYDGVDQNCDLANDWDADGDGYTSLYQTDGTGNVGTDCFDLSTDSFSDPAGLGAAAVNPAAADSWYDGTDQNCDGASDFDQDADGQDFDSYGGTDCDDRDAAIRVGVVEDCATADDDNCNGVLDEEDASACTDWYYDGDGDGHGEPGNVACWCEPQVATNYDVSAAEADDCDDGAATVNPDAPEVCDTANTDEDCDGLADDADTGATGGTAFYPDEDGDGQGDATVSGAVSCDQPSDLVVSHTDCDDSDPAIYFGAQEICDAANTDEDCDGDTDDGDISVDAGSKTTWYADDDGDSYGDPATGQARCEAPTGTVTDDQDCDDTIAAINPAAQEICDAANTDEDCDGLTDDNDDSSTGKSSYYVDGDGDGQGAGAVVAWCDVPAGYSTDADDCDDDDAVVYLGAPELCATAHDDDCDGEANETAAIDAATWYADRDGDTYGDPSDVAPACTQPVGYVADFGDCNDAVATANPAGTEICNNRDDDCDGTSDENTATDASTWYFDNDGDSYGDATDTTVACLAPTDFVYRAEDCDDTRSGVNPAASERCNTAYDDDCDGTINEDDAVGTTTFYADTDADGYGDLGNTYAACVVPAGYTTDTQDCNDEDVLAYPGATERCATAYDDDCDGLINEAGAVGLAYYYTDSDGDGYGDPADTTATAGCSLIPGQASNTDDCDDTRALVNPDADELCSTVYDDDCDGTANENGAADATTYYDDDDGDGYGDADDTASIVYACGAVTGHVTNSTDCDDAQANANPGETETCTTLYDDDCDGTANVVGTSDGTLYYTDSDGDGYGISTGGLRYCTAPSGRSTLSTDCDDTNAGISPADAERCDTAYDDDCDSSINEDGAVGAVSYYADTDADTYGNASSSRLACVQPSGYVTNDDDCSDTNNAAYPSAPELCTTYGTDNDCDGSTTDATDELTWYYDSDNDTYAGATTLLACTDPGTRYYSTNTDCNDASTTVYPSAPELCLTEGIDNDCDGDAAEASNRTLWYTDADGDTYGDDEATGTSACTAPVGTVATNTDCNDSAIAVNPGASEVCDSLNTDEDCDGLADNNDPSAATGGKTTYYRDADVDTYGTSTLTSVQCDQPSGYVTSSTDCNDANAAINPAATEICDASNVDEDCDGLADNADSSASSSGMTTWYIDSDSDGYGASSGSVLNCDVPTGYAATSTDCNDASAAINPGEQELCADEGTDNDCNSGTTTPADQVAYYDDLDGDGYGNEDDLTSTFACSAPTGAVANRTDCDDGNDWVFPGAPVYCDAIDNDCDVGVESETGVVTGIDPVNGLPVVINGYETVGGPLSTGWGTTSLGTVDYTFPSDIDVINVCDGSYYVNITVADGASPRLVSLVGMSSLGASNTTLYGTGNNGSILRVIAQTSAHEVEVSDLSFARGAGTDIGGSEVVGGAIYVTANSNPSNPNVTLTDCILYDNDLSSSVSDTYGGAIAVGSPSGSTRYGKVALVNTEVLGNRADYGGAVYISRGAVTATCAGGEGFTDNIADTGLGGAFEFASSAFGDLTVTTCDMGGSVDETDENTANDIAYNATVFDYSGVDSFVCTTGSGLSCTP